MVNLEQSLAPVEQSTDANVNNKEAATTVQDKDRQMGDHLLKTALDSAKRLGLTVNLSQTQWSMNLKGSADKASVRIPDPDALKVGETMHARAFITIGLTAFEESAVPAVDVLITRRVQDALLQLGKAECESKEARKQLAIGAGFEPSKEAKEACRLPGKGAGFDKAKLKKLYLTCEQQLSQHALATVALVGANPVGVFFPNPPDKATWSVSKVWECPKGCYTEDPAFDGDRQPGARNMGYVNHETGEFTEEHIRAKDAHFSTTCQKCQTPGVFADGGVEALVTHAKARYEVQVAKANGDYAAGAKSVPEACKLEAKQEVTRDVATWFTS
jgi:hypothetical protein